MSKEIQKLSQAGQDLETQILYVEKDSHTSLAIHVPLAEDREEKKWCHLAPRELPTDVSLLWANFGQAKALEQSGFENGRSASTSRSLSR